MPTIFIDLLGPARLRVEYDYSLGRPGRMYMPNGDPGYPDEPDELEVTDTVLEHYVVGAHAWSPAPFNLPIELLDTGYIEAQCMADVEARAAAAEDARYEALAEAREHARELEDWNP